MPGMSNFEIRANNIQTAINTTRNRIEDFGYEDDSAEESVSRVIGMYITWLTSSEEARQQSINSNATFRKNVIDVLPTNDDPSWDHYIEPAPTSTLKQRAEALWGIRIAFTHGDGDIDLITNTTNKNFALNAPSVFNSVSINSNKMMLNESIYHTAIKTMVQIRDVLPLSN